MKPILALLAALVLSACSTNTILGKFTSDDAVAASALAQSKGDAAGKKCYDWIYSDIASRGAAPDAPGLLYLNELRRTASSSVADLVSACNGVLPIRAVPILLP